MIWKILQNIHRDHYICDVKWLDTGSLAVLWMNRSLGVDQPCDRVCKNNDCNDDNDDGCNDDTDESHNLECVHRLQNTSFYSLCPPPDYQCNQVLMIDIILIMIMILIIIQLAIIFIQVWNIQIIVTKALLKALLSLIISFHSHFFRFMQKVWLTEAVEDGLRTEDFQPSARWGFFGILVFNWSRRGLWWS